MVFASSDAPEGLGQWPSMQPEYLQAPTSTAK